MWGDERSGHGTGRCPTVSIQRQGYNAGHGMKRAHVGSCVHARIRVSLTCKLAAVRSAAPDRDCRRPLQFVVRRSLGGLHTRAQDTPQ